MECVTGTLSTDQPDAARGHDAWPARCNHARVLPRVGAGSCALYRAVPRVMSLSPCPRRPVAICQPEKISATACACHRPTDAVRDRPTDRPTDAMCNRRTDYRPMHSAQHNIARVLCASAAGSFVAPCGAMRYVPVPLSPAASRNLPARKNFSNACVRANVRARNVCAWHVT